MQKMNFAGKKNTGSAGENSCDRIFQIFFGMMLIEKQHLITQLSG
jgi:hypothetical protein